MKKKISLPNLQQIQSKNEVREALEHWLESLGLKVKEINFDKPWGGYFVFDDSAVDVFLKQFFPKYKNLKTSRIKMSPKLLIVAPQARLSWQYHHRRQELWRVLQGPVGVVRSMTDGIGEVVDHFENEVVEIGKQERHRLVGLKSWGLIAEIWHHILPDHPSDEDDIVRLEDDYQRT